MPLIVVYNLTNDELKDAVTIEKLERIFSEVIEGIPELELNKDQVSFSFLQDPSVETTDVPVTIIVELLLDKPKRTSQVRQRLADKIAGAFLSIRWNKGRQVEVAVKRFNPSKDGFCSRSM